MSITGLDSPEKQVTELQFPVLTKPAHVEVTEERFNILSRQAYVLEFAANSVLASYSTAELGADLWIAHHAPQLVTYHQGLIPEQYADVAETRIMMAQEFERRVNDGQVSEIDHSRILEGLLAFEDPILAQAVADVIAGFVEVTDLCEAPGYLSAGNNAVACKLKDLPGVDGDALVKIGYVIEAEQSGSDRSSFTNLHRWLGLLAGKGVNGFEQPIAFSAEQPISVTKYAPGIELFELSKLKTKPQPSEESLIRFADAVYESIVRRITIDIHGRDILYDPDTDTLTIIDHSAFSRAYSHIASSYIETVEAIVDTFKASFGYEFDEIAFKRLLDEFSRQGLHDRKLQAQEALEAT